MKIKILSLLLSISVLLGCSITTTANFESDFSGMVVTKLNFEKYFDFLTYTISKKSENGSSQEIEKASIAKEEMRLKLLEEFSQIFLKMKAICEGRGIENFNINAQEKEIIINYSFKSLDALNYAYNALEFALGKNDQKTVDLHNYFELKGEKLIYQEKQLNDIDKGQYMKYDKKGDMMRYITVFNFNQSFKKLRTQGEIEIREDNKQIKFETNLGDYIKGEVISFEIKF